MLGLVLQSTLTLCSLVRDLLPNMNSEPLRLVIPRFDRVYKIQHQWLKVQSVNHLAREDFVKRIVKKV